MARIAIVETTVHSASLRIGEDNGFLEIAELHDSAAFFDVPADQALQHAEEWLENGGYRIDGEWAAISRGWVVTLAESAT